MRFASEAEEGDDPSLADMTEKAVRILQKEEKGFFLAVEGKYHGPCALAITYWHYLTIIIGNQLSLVGRYIP